MNRSQTDNSPIRLHTALDAVLRDLPLSNRKPIRPRRTLQSNNDDVTRLKDYQVQYLKRKAAGVCTATGCPAKAEWGHTHCRKHLQLMCRRHKERYSSRARKALCIYCGERPQFWGVRCIICRQKFAKSPLPLGARRALRLYRKAERQSDIEHAQVEGRLAARKLLASGDVKGAYAKALRFYAGTDDGKWRTYNEVSQLMGISKERVRQLLVPSKGTLIRSLGDRVPGRRGTQESPRQSDSKQ